MIFKIRLRDRNYVSLLEEFACLVSCAPGFGQVVPPGMHDLASMCDAHLRLPYDSVGDGMRLHMRGLLAASWNEYVREACPEKKETLMQMFSAEAVPYVTDNDDPGCSVAYIFMSAMPGRQIVIL